MRCFRRGLTLIELVVVMVLTAVLMLTATTVLRSLLAAQREKGPAIHMAEIANLLRRDVTNARGIRLTESGFELRGELGRNQELAVELIACVVRYEAEQFGEQTILWRREYRNGQTKSIPLSVGQIDVALANLADIEPGSRTENGWYLVPPRVDLLLVDRDGNTVYRESVLRDSISKFVGYRTLPVRWADCLAALGAFFRCHICSVGMAL
ncbi:MAG: type II secretion system protein [Aureliella sp.]